MIWLLSVAGWLRKGLDAALALAQRYPLHCALLASLAANLWLWRGWEREQTARAADRAAYAQAQAAAAAHQAEADRANLVAQIQRNHHVEQTHAQTETARAAALRDYLERHRLRPQAACRPPGSAGAPAVPADPAEPAQPDPAADLAAITPTDLDQLTRGALRGAECTGFLQSLIDGGMARAWEAEGEDMP
jgi:hypothetical protein